jgi:hypothetical protein
MDPWQASVEKRLDSLDRRLTSIENDVSSVKVDVGAIKVEISHLPSKGFIVSTTIAALTLLSLIVAVLANLDRILPNNAPSSFRTEPPSGQLRHPN